MLFYIQASAVRRYNLLVGSIRHFQFRVNCDAYTSADFYQQGVISALSVIGTASYGVCFRWTESDLRIHENEAVV